VASQRLARAIPLENNCMVEWVGIADWGVWRSPQKGWADSTNCATPKELEPGTLDPVPHSSLTLVMESNLQQRQFCVWSKLNSQAAHLSR